jgi:hypothetical protein
MTQSDVEYIKEHVTPKQVVESFSIAVNREGYCSCPFHSEKTGSMKLYPDNKGYYCFGCHDGGDVLKLAQKLYGLPFKATVEVLNRDFQLGLNLDRRLSPQEVRQAQKAQIEAKKRKRAQAIDYACAILEWEYYLDRLLALERWQEMYEQNGWVEASTFAQIFWELEKTRYYLSLAEERRRAFYGTTSE